MVVQLMSLRVLVVHNTYKQRGGEDSVVDSEIALLREHGNTVETWFCSNDELDGMSALGLAARTLWSTKTQHTLAERMSNFRPDLIHAHNTFPLISPSLYWAAARAKVPVIQTLHNFRLMCLNALFLRNGAVCEDCMGRLPWRGVIRSCYRGSHAASTVLAGMLTLHRALGTYSDKVTRYIALNEFCRSKFIDAGLPPERIAVKPNFVDFEAPEAGPRSGLLFVGRLSLEKGIATLSKAVAKSPGAHLTVVGDGPETNRFNGLEYVTSLGSQSNESVRREMTRAQALIVPSIWYENFPRTIVESFACGTPVIASRIGSLACIVEDGKTGLLFEPSDADDLAAKIEWASQNPREMAEMGRRARQRFENEFSADVNYQKLMEIYDAALRSGPGGNSSPF